MVAIQYAFRMATNEIFASVRRATVGIIRFRPGDTQKPYSIVGSGFCIDSSGIIITCQHVVSAFLDKTVSQRIAEIPPAERKTKLNHLDNVKMEVPFVIFMIPGDVAHQVKVLLCPVDQIMARKDFDLAIVRTAPHTAQPQGYSTVQVENYEDINEGDEVATCGYPLGDFLFEQTGTITSSFTRGSLSSIIPTQGIPLEHLRQFQLDLTATYGNSGGPVFSVKNGKVFGVLQGGIMDTKANIFPGLSRAMPIYPILNPAGIALIKSAPRGRLPSSDAIKTAWGVPS